MQKTVICLDDPVSPTVLAKILKISPSMIYEARESGKLLKNKDSSYIDNIQCYIQYYKDRSKFASKATNLIEKKLVQDIKNGIAKEEETHLKIQKERGNLIDIYEFEKVIYPVINLIKSGLIALRRKLPMEYQDNIDTLLKTWEGLGQRLKEEALLDSDNYVQAKLDRNVLEDIENVADSN